MTRRARISLNDSAGVAREKLIEMVASEYRENVPALLEPSRDFYSPLRSPSEDEIERIAAGAGHLLELRFKQGAPEGTPPELAIRETYHAIQTYFELKAERRPAVIVLEDLQWADPASIDLLQTLYGNLPDLPILVVALMEDEFLEQWPEWEDSFVNHTLLKLRPLATSEMQLLCQQILKKVDALPSTVCDRLVALADGTPLQMEEAIKLLLRKGLIAQSLLDDRWHLNPVEIDEFTFPDTLEGLIEAQLECLAEKPLGVGERGAVIGLTFWQTWLTEMGRDKGGEEEPGPQPKHDEDIQPQLTTLVRSGFITSKLFSQMDGDREFEFRHPLVREQFLKRLSKQSRKRYHQFVHDWYDSRRQDRRTEYLDRLAAHAEAGFSFKKAFEHWRELAIAAIHLCAYGCAELYVKKAMNLLSSNRLKLAGGLKLEYKFQLYETLAELYRLQGLDAEWRSTVDTLRRIAEQAENPELSKRVDELASE